MLVTATTISPVCEILTDYSCRVCLQRTLCTSSIYCGNSDKCAKIIQVHLMAVLLTILKNVMTDVSDAAAVTKRNER